jgi:hypothetical protein
VAGGAFLYLLQLVSTMRKDRENRVQIINFVLPPPVITATLDLFPKLPGQATVREQRQHFWKRLRFDF